MSRVDIVRKLRREQTEAEDRFWAEVRGRLFRGLKWRRQVPIDNYIADFVCESEKLIVELDGSQHMDTQNYDEVRTQALERHGYRVLRFWNEDVFKHMEFVWAEIEASIGDISPHPAAALPRGPLSPRSGYDGAVLRGQTQYE